MAAVEMPFNISHVNDNMRKLKPRFSLQLHTRFRSFRAVCQHFEDEGLLKVGACSTCCTSFSASFSA
jgi:hypothetical protein